MTFPDILSQGFLGYYANHNLSGTTYAVVWGIGILLCMLTYFVGSLNFSIIISKAFYQDDIRKYGSGNAGTTNMLRTYGRRAAGLTLVGDAVKAIVSSVFGYALMGYTGAYIAGFFCILGHCFPIYYRFRGGKGIVTVAFMLLMLDPVIFAILFFVFAALIIATKMVSFGSVICVMLFPLILFRLRGPGDPIIFAMLITILVVFMHRENIMRIFHGQESKLDFSKLFSKKKNTEPAEEAVEEEIAEEIDEAEEEIEELPAASVRKKPHAISNAKKKRLKKQRDEARRHSSQN